MTNVGSGRYGLPSDTTPGSPPNTGTGLIAVQKFVKSSLMAEDILIC